MGEAALLVEGVRLDQTVVAGHFDQSAPGQSQTTKRFIDQRCASAPATRCLIDDQDCDPPNRRVAVDMDARRQPAHPGNLTIDLNDQSRRSDNAKPRPDIFRGTIVAKLCHQSNQNAGVSRHCVANDHSVSSA